MFKKIQELETHHQVIFALMIAFALVSFWRGMWGLLDIYLLPESPTLPVGFCCYWNCGFNNDQLLCEDGGVRI